MVKSGLLARAMADLDQILDAPSEQLVTTRVESLEKALELAMRTIDLAADGISGHATFLAPLDENATEYRTAVCPVELPRTYRTKAYHHYFGYYHTDMTLPKTYFTPEAERPAGTPLYELDLTYLFNRSIENPDYQTMGEGQQIRARDAEVPLSSDVSSSISLENSSRKGIATEEGIDSHPLLREALKEEESL
jgi:hypothetical protein